MQSAIVPKLQIHKEGQGDITFLRLSGTVDESFDTRLSRGLEGQLVISLAEVSRITSFGIRQWLDFITAASEHCQSVYLVECSLRIVDQLNLVANFAAGALVVSFYAPFRCSRCGHESLRLVHVEKERELLFPFQIEGEPCPNDGRPEEFDDDPEGYCFFLAGQPPFAMNPAVRAFLASRAQYALPDEPRKVRVEKKIRDRYTFITISGDIDDSLPIEKMGEGLEGDVVFDLAGVRRFTEGGVSRWRSLMHNIAPGTERILVLGLPALALEHVARNQDLAKKGQVLSLCLPFSCKSCAVTTQREIDVSQHFDDLRLASLQEMSCPNCGEQAACVASTAMLHGLTDLPQPARDLDTEKLQQWARAPFKIAGKPAVAGTESRLTSRLRSAASRLVSVNLLVGLAIIAIIGAAAVILAGVEWGGETAPTGARKNKGKLIEASHPTSPRWKDQTFTVRGNEVLVTGTSGYVSDKASGLKQARATALEELVHQVAASIRDPVWIEDVGAQYQQFRAKLLGDLEKALVAEEKEAVTRARRRVQERRDQVAAALMATSKSLFQAEQSSFYWEKVQFAAEVQYQVWALFRVRKPEIRRLVEYYTHREEALSASAVPYFPGMAWRFSLTQGAVVVGLKPDSPLRYIGVLPGDVFIAAQDRAIRDARSFRRILDQEQADLERTGGTMLLRIQRGDGPVAEHRLRVAKKKRWRRHRGPKDKRLPPANIWDDNPFE